MEEILASIRRIISEEGEAEGAEANEPTAEPHSIEEPASSEGILELTRMVKEDGTVVDLPPGAEAAEQDFGEEAEAMVEDNHPEAPEPEPEQAGAPEPEAGAASEPEPDIELQAVEQAGEATAGALDAVAKGLVSEETAALSTAALSALAEAVAREQVNVTGRSLEDLVKEILRPLLKEWLDKNLPDLIERLVRQEIEKMAKRVTDRL